MSLKPKFHAVRYSEVWETLICEDLSLVVYHIPQAYTNPGRLLTRETKYFEAPSSTFITNIAVFSERTKLCFSSHTPNRKRHITALFTGPSSIMCANYGT